jgi:hypothetical protein
MRRHASHPEPQDDDDQDRKPQAPLSPEDVGRWLEAFGATDGD